MISLLFMVDKFAVLCLTHFNFSHIAEGGYPFYKLFSKAISGYGMICIGLYRYICFIIRSSINLNIMVSFPVIFTNLKLQIIVSLLGDQIRAFYQMITCALS